MIKYEKHFEAKQKGRNILDLYQPPFERELCAHLYFLSPLLFATLYHTNGLRSHLTKIWRIKSHKENSVFRK